MYVCRCSFLCCNDCGHWFPCSLPLSFPGRGPVTRDVLVTVPKGKCTTETRRSALLPADTPRNKRWSGLFGHRSVPVGRGGLIGNLGTARLFPRSGNRALAPLLVPLRHHDFPTPPLHLLPHFTPPLPFNRPETHDSCVLGGFYPKTAPLQDHLHRFLFPLR